jgi:7-cyano-7-deazaguanine reductase
LARSATQVRAFHHSKPLVERANARTREPANAVYHSPAMPSQPSKELVAIPNPHPDREYEVECVCPEFTCICPMTGQPDFATFNITYVPGPKIVELKSLKLYLWSFRQEGVFHEDVTNTILDDLVASLTPRRMTVESVWNVRGGITTKVRASYP